MELEELCWTANEIPKLYNSNLNKKEMFSFFDPPPQPHPSSCITAAFCNAICPANMFVCIAGCHTTSCVVEFYFDFCLFVLVKY